MLLGDADAPAIRHAAAALAEAGVPTCGGLAALTQAAVEVRFGAAGCALWALARADDRRSVFRHAARELPSASVSWTEYELREPGPLVFAVSGLVGRVCETLGARGEAAGTLTLTFALAGGGALARRVSGARETADAATWRRLVRAELERLGHEGDAARAGPPPAGGRAGEPAGPLADGVVGLALAVDAAREARAPQSDLFDRGAASAGAAERAVARLVEDGIGRVVRPRASAHALPEARVLADVLEVEAAVRALTAPTRAGGAPLRAPAPTGLASADGRTPRGGAPPADERAAAGTDTAAPRLTLVRPSPERPVPGRAPGHLAARADDAGPRAADPAPLVLLSSDRPAGHGEPAAEFGDVFGGDPCADALRLRLYPTPRALAMTTRPARGHRVPARYRVRLAEGERARRTPGRGRGQPLVDVVTAAGPDRVVTGYDVAGAPLAREYWHCLTDQGTLTLVYRDLVSVLDAPADAGGVGPAAAGAAGPVDREASDTWFLHGWWD